MTYSVRTRSIGWAVIFLVCAAVFTALTLKVNAVRSEVQLAERKIIALEREKRLLETEFETRANQQQLADWNAVDFGYRPPSAGQFMADERDLASLGAPRAKGAPEPIQMAMSESELPSGENPGGASILSMVSPLTGKPMEEGEIKAAEGNSEEISPLPEVKKASQHELEIIERLTQPEQASPENSSDEAEGGQ